MGCKLLEIMADGMYAVSHRFEAFLKKKVDAQVVTVGCPSNGRCASSISALPAPAAQTSAGGTACSLLRAAGCVAALASPPDCTHPHLLLFCGDGRRTSKPSYSSTWETTAECFLAPCCSLPRPRRRPPPWCSRRGLINVVNERYPSEVDCTWRG